MTRSLAALALAPALTACVAFPIGIPPGHVRAAMSAAYGDLDDKPAGSPLVAVHAGLAPASLWSDRRAWDVEVGYAADAFLEAPELSAQGGYVSGAWMPFLLAEGAVRLRMILGLDVDVLRTRDVVAFGSTLSVGAELAGFANGTGWLGSLSGGYAGLLYGEWSVGVCLQGAYRYVDGASYGTIGAGLTLRWPAGGGVGYVTALGLVPAGGSSGAQAISGYESNREPDEPRHPPAPPARFVCRDPDGNSGEADTLEEARVLCPHCSCAERR
jgi:hypothetical protein